MLSLLESVEHPVIDCNAFILFGKACAEKKIDAGIKDRKSRLSFLKSRVTTSYVGISLDTGA
jgi:hypothetical protein